MEILNKGRRLIEWFYGDCASCYCTFRVQRDELERCDDSPELYTHPCPTCGNNCYLSRKLEREEIKEEDVKWVRDEQPFRL